MGVSPGPFRGDRNAGFNCSRIFFLFPRTQAALSHACDERTLYVTFFLACDLNE